MNWYVDVLKNYVGFSGRARRQEFWMFTLFNAIALIVLVIVGALIDTQILYSIYVLAIFLPSLAVTFRRLHDTGRSGWWVLLGIIPLVGFIVLLVFTATEGQAGANEYGPDPKHVG